MLSVGQLKVIMYVPPHDPAKTWRLEVRPVIESAYYACVKNNDESAYHEYVDRWAKRHPNVKAKYPYDGYFLQLVNGIRADGGYNASKVTTDKIMSIYKGTKWLLEGQRRASIICALFGPDVQIPLEVVAQELPTDLDQDSL